MKFLLPFKITKRFRWWPESAADLLLAMPEHFFGCFLDMMREGSRWPTEYLLVEMAPFLGGNAQIDYMIDYFAASKIESCSNPLYSLVGRSDGPVCSQH